ncbi:hypothetical protein [Mycolicibacterium goodii]|uniref:hypothetical protein n=1 Tax=Mycolicibacterium goodii TaxID=134601 RepID=UPI0027E014B5|nr:hypothetical protein [Mycolicibacterium goodii]
MAELLGSGAEPGSVVWVDTEDGGPVAGWLVVEHPNCVDEGGERRCAVVQAESCSVVSAGLISEVQVSAGPIPTENPMPEWVKALAASYWAVQEAFTERDAARLALRKNEERLERIVDAAHEYADENDLCERFDDFMEGQGLRPRMREWVCEVDATVRVRVAVTARSAEAASSGVDDAMVVTALAELSGRGLSDALQDRDVVDVEEA